MKKSLVGIVAIATIVWSLGLGALIPAVSAAYVPTAGDIIKINAANRSAVYVVGSDLKPYVFSTRSTYASWLDDFSALKNVTQADFDNMTMGGNVTVKPGSLIKFDNSDNVYVAVPGNKLCKLPTAATDAKALYGDSYESRVLLIQGSFVGNYTVDPTCALDRDSKLPDGSLIQYAGSATYYIENGLKRLVYSDQMILNGFKYSNIIYNVPASKTYQTGSPVVSKEAGLADFFLTNNARAPFIDFAKMKLIRQAFAEKYNRNVNEISVSFDKEVGNYTRGAVTYGAGGVGEGGFFFATIVDSKWKIISDGNGAVDCAALKTNNFPASVAPECPQL
jgi:hypothetical protein